MPADQPRTSASRFWQVVVALLALETGVFLLIVPWSGLWEESLFMGFYSILRPLLRNHYLRGAVSGLGLATLWVGVSSALELSFRRTPPLKSDEQ